MELEWKQRNEAAAEAVAVAAAAALYLNIGLEIENHKLNKAIKLLSNLVFCHFQLKLIECSFNLWMSNTQNIVVHGLFCMNNIEIKKMLTSKSEFMQQKIREKSTKIRTNNAN